MIPRRCGGGLQLSAEVLELLEQLRAIGTQRVYLQMLDLSDLDHIWEIARDALPGRAGAWLGTRRVDLSAITPARLRTSRGAPASPRRSTPP